MEGVKNNYKNNDRYDGINTDKTKLKLEFIIEIELNGKKWYIRRKLKDFIELNNIIAVMFNQ